MKILGGRRDIDSEETTRRRRKIKVDILGRGRSSTAVTPEKTVHDLRQSLNVGGNVRAVDEMGKLLSDSDKVFGKKEVNFLPNVKGGSI